MTRTLALTDKISMPAVGFGTYLIDPEQTELAVRTAIALGYRHIDTATAYSNETEVGSAVRMALDEHKLSRSEIFVTSKFAPGWVDETPKDAKQTLAEANESLDRLGIDYIDLYLIHAPFGGPERLNQWRALIDFQRSGGCRAIGVSNFNQQQLEEIREAGLPMPAANQIELHPWSQKPELLSYMREHGILPIAYSSLLPLANWRHRAGEASAKTDKMNADSGSFAPMAKKYDVSEAQLLLRWGLQSGFAILPKSLDPVRMAQNLDVEGFEISDGDMAAIAKMDRGPGVAWEAGDPLFLAHD